MLLRSMESLEEENSVSYYRLYEKIALVSLLKREMTKTSGIDSNGFGRCFHCDFLLGNLGCITPDTQTKKKKQQQQQQQNVNNNNNTSTITRDQLLHFYVFNVTRERNLHLATSSDDKRLLIFQNISNSLYKIGLRNGESFEEIACHRLKDIHSGDVLIYLNHLNLLHPPIALTLDRVKSEFTALRKQNQLIHIGICRCSDRAVLNNTSIKHLGALTFEQFENLSLENRKSSSSIVLTESKKLLHLFSNKKKSVSSSKRSSARDSGFIENDGK